MYSFFFYHKLKKKKLFKNSKTIIAVHIFTQVINTLKIKLISIFNIYAAHNLKN